jgi:hypothetical protein
MGWFNTPSIFQIESPLPGNTTTIVYQLIYLLINPCSITIYPYWPFICIQYAHVFEGKMTYRGILLHQKDTRLPLVPISLFIPIFASFGVSYLSRYIHWLQLIPSPQRSKLSLRFSLSRISLLLNTWRDENSVFYVGSYIRTIAFVILKNRNHVLSPKYLHKQLQ